MWEYNNFLCIMANEINFIATGAISSLYKAEEYADMQVKLATELELNRKSITEVEESTLVQEIYNNQTNRLSCYQNFISAHANISKILWLSPQDERDLAKSGLIVEDASRDDRFADNPFVIEGIKFYAGVPLVTPEGNAIGTLCVVSNEPRFLTQFQHESLLRIARLIMIEMGWRLKRPQPKPIEPAHEIDHPLENFDCLADDDRTADLKAILANIFYLSHETKKCGLDKASSILKAALLAISAAYSKTNNPKCELLSTKDIGDLYEFIDALGKISKKERIELLKLAKLNDPKMH